jgi:hypothetical protein
VVLVAAREPCSSVSRTTTKWVEATVVSRAGWVGGSALLEVHVDEGVVFSEPAAAGGRLGSSVGMGLFSPESVVVLWNLDPTCQRNELETKIKELAHSLNFDDPEEEEGKEEACKKGPGSGAFVRFEFELGAGFVCGGLLKTRPF